MKAPAEAGRLHRHRKQALDYWTQAADAERGIPQPPYVVVCAFRRLEVHEPGRFFGKPRAEFDLVELPEQPEALAFLAGDEPIFSAPRGAVTREAVALLGELFASLSARQDDDEQELREFLLQAVWCMFAEDLGLLPRRVFTQVVEDLIAQPSRSSRDDLGQLFRLVNDPSPSRPAHGRYAGVPYVDGGLFRHPAEVHLDRHELDLLRGACLFDWTQVEPQIFGSLLEGCLGKDRQWALGAHYTHEADIQKIVQPTIVRPWTERIENASTAQEVAATQADLRAFTVLDPACGSGNFLYVAYRELRRLEARLRERQTEFRSRRGMAPEQGSLALYYPLSNLYGIDIDRFAIELARVTLWIGHKLAVDELGLAEQTLPLTGLHGLSYGDALKMDWPAASVIIGNPPFHGSQQMRRELGDDYVEWLKRTYGIGVKDYCTYWFRRAHDHLERGARAGLVGTNSIAQNRARPVSLEYITGNGGVITDAVSRQDWPGDAVVNVAIVNWVKDPPVAPTPLMLDGEAVGAITPALRPRLGPEAARALAENRLRAFQGPMPVGEGFVLAADEARRVLARPEASYADVVRPYIVGDDIAEDPEQAPRRFVIDFALRTLEEAMAYPAALDILRTRVKTVRELNKDRYRRQHWWLLGRPVRSMRNAIKELDRYVAGTAQGKRIMFVWCEPSTCPSNLTNVFAFRDDYAMGVLTSRLHGEWARMLSSLRVDIRYTPTTSFETYPWHPDPSTAEREAIAEACRAVFGRRGAICRDRQIGLTTLYNQVDEGAWTDLRDVHRWLDATVAAAYGWPADVADDPNVSNARLLDLNQRIIAGEVAYRPFAYLDQAPPADPGEPASPIAAAD